MSKKCAVCELDNPEEAVLCVFCNSILPITESESETKPVGTAEPASGSLERVLLGKYKVEQMLGKGEYTEVYAALSTKPPTRRYALKCYKTRTIEDRRIIADLFQRAVKVKELRHEHIVTVYSYLPEDEFYIVAMDIAEGTNAATYVHKYGALSPYEVWEIAQALLKALGYAHKQGVVHGNIKASNVFIPTSPQFPIVLSDFCLGAVGWNPSTTIYAAPELLSGQQDDPRSDQFSLAVVLFELLTGKLPFNLIKTPDGSGLQRSRINKSDITALPQPLRGMIERMLSRRHEERFPSMEAALQSIDAGQAKSLSRDRPPANAVGIAEENQARNLLEEATIALNVGDLERARNRYEEAAKLSPNDIEIKRKLNELQQLLNQKRLFNENLALGKQALRDKKYETAVMAFSQAEQLDPAHPEVPALLIKARQLLAQQQAEQKKAPITPPPQKQPVQTQSAPPPPKPAPVQPIPTRIIEPPPKQSPTRPVTLPPKPAEPPKPIYPVLPPIEEQPVSKVPWKLFAGVSIVFVIVISFLIWYLMSLQKNPLVAVNNTRVATAKPPTRAPVATSAGQPEQHVPAKSDTAPVVIADDALDFDIAPRNIPPTPVPEPVSNPTMQPKPSPVPEFLPFDEPESEPAAPQSAKVRIIDSYSKKENVVMIYLDGNQLSGKQKEYVVSVTPGTHIGYVLSVATGAKDYFALIAQEGRETIYELLPKEEKEGKKETPPPNPIPPAPADELKEKEADKDS